MDRLEEVAANLTAHARRRMAQRGVRDGDLEYVLRHGRRIRNGNGSLYIFLGRRDVPESDQRGRGWKLVGTTVVLDGNAVVTVYRNPRATRELKRRRKRQD